MSVKRSAPLISAILLAVFVIVVVLLRLSKDAVESANDSRQPGSVSPSSIDRGRERNGVSVRRSPPSNERYRVIHEKLTWSQAQQRCEELGGHLATLVTKEENDFVSSLISGATTDESSYWIGLILDRQRGFWRWINADAAKVMFWSRGSPSDAGDGSVAAIAKQGRWVDLDSDQKVYEKVLGFVCEWDDSPAPIGSTPPSAAAFHEHRYAFFCERVSWFWAKTRCEQMGGHLATITSKEENEFVASLLPRARNYDTFYWIGLLDETKKRAWKWITGEEFSYQDWRPGEPNNAGGNEYYVAMTASPEASVHGTWNDFEGPHRTHDIIVGFVCEWDEPNPPVVNRSARPDGIVVRTGSPVPLHSFKGHRYAVVTEPVTWSQAEARCKELGGRLLTAESKEEWDFILQIVLRPTPLQTFYWIGLTDTEKQGDWRWITGGKPAFIKWLPGEPNNFGGNEHYVAILATTDPLQHGGLNDLEGPNRVHDVVVGYVCKFDK